MAAIKLTAKRQATLPRSLCDELDVGPGDEIALERRVFEGQTLWIMRPCKVDWSWIGATVVPANVSHAMAAMRDSIARGRKRERP
jgi:bifunctional DNA-binding transcriptional regulator/antitoxin component of YhaV-PrlF toxin-antitoxin module